MPMRGAHPLDPPLGHLPGVGLGAEQDPVGAQLRDADDHRLGAAVQQAVHDAAAEPGDTVKADAAREPERPARTDLAADLQGVGARTACAGPAHRRRGAQSPGLPIRWTSTRKLRDPTIGSASSARRGPRLRASLRAVCRRTSARVAAPATNPVAATAAAWTAGAATPASATGWRAPRPARACPRPSPRPRPGPPDRPRRRRRRSARPRCRWTRGETSAAYGDSVRGQVQSRDKRALTGRYDYLCSDVDIDRRLRQGARARAHRSAQSGARPRRPPLFPHARGPHAPGGGDGGPGTDHARLQQLSGADGRRARQAGRAGRAEPLRDRHHRIALPQRHA